MRAWSRRASAARSARFRSSRLSARSGTPWLPRSTAGSPGLAAENLQARVRGVRPHGAVEHLRLARRLDGEQVGARGRLLDALRRHGRRLRSAEGRVQDGRVPPRRAPQRAGGAATSSRAARSSAPRPPSCATTSATRTRSPRTTSWTRCSRRTSRRTARARSFSPSSTPRWSSEPWRSSTAPSTSGARLLPG